MHVGQTIMLQRDMLLKTCPAQSISLSEAACAQHVVDKYEHMWLQYRDEDWDYQQLVGLSSNEVSQIKQDSCT